MEAGACCPWFGMDGSQNAHAILREQLAAEQNALIARLRNPSRPRYAKIDPKKQMTSEAARLLSIGNLLQERA